MERKSWRSDLSISISKLISSSFFLPFLSLETFVRNLSILLMGLHSGTSKKLASLPSSPGHRTIQPGSTDRSMRSSFRARVVLSPISWKESIRERQSRGIDWARANSTMIDEGRRVEEGDRTTNKAKDLCVDGAHPPAIKPGGKMVAR